MLLCGIDDARVGMVLGVTVHDTRAPDQILLQPGVTLDRPLLAGLRARGVLQLWVEDDLTKDLDEEIGAKLTGARLELYTTFRNDLAAMSRRTLTAGTVKNYRRAITDMVRHATSTGAFGSLTDSLFSADDELGAHSVNVAYLSLLVGLQLEPYVVSEQPRLDLDQARDLSILGLAGLLHDIGKAGAPAPVAGRHAIHADASDEVAQAYREHVVAGHRLLAYGTVPARVGNTALNHHQRWDGRGWPEMSIHTAGRVTGTLSERSIHIFPRIVAAANVLETLLRISERRGLPPVAALSAFASTKFDGWFDPVIRRALLTRVPPFVVGSDVRLNTGARAVVVAPNPASPCRPSIRLRDDEPSPGARHIELATRPDLRITHAVGVEVAHFHFDMKPLAALAA